MSILSNRIRYVLSPQFDIYEQIAKVVYGQVADIGFGLGFGTQLLKARADQVDGFEIDPEAIRFARSAFAHCARFLRGDIARQRLETKYDYVVMVDVIEHIALPKQAVRNVAESLTDDGIFICSTPNKASRYRKSENHIREFSPEELKTLLGECFQIVELKTYPWNPIQTGYENPLIAVCKKMKG